MATSTIRSSAHLGEAFSIVATLPGTGSIANQTLQFTLKKAKSDLVALLTKSTTAGNVVITDPINRVVSINFVTGDTNLLLAGTYLWDLWRIDVGFETDYLDGSLKLSARVAVTV